MIKMFALMRRRNGMSHEAFVDRYETIHAPLYLSYNKNIYRYVRNYINVPESIRMDRGSGLMTYDSLTEFWFTEDGFRKSMGASYAPIMAADEAEFVDQEASIYGLVEEYKDFQDWDSYSADGGEMIISLLKRGQEITEKEFRERFRHEHTSLMEEADRSLTEKYTYNYFLDPIMMPADMAKVFDFDAYTKRRCKDKAAIEEDGREIKSLCRKNDLINQGKSMLLHVDEVVSDIKR